MTRVFSILACLTALLGCGEQETVPIQIAFEGLVDGLPANCGSAYANIGTSGASYTLQDFRLYVHDLWVVAADGAEFPIELEQDGRFQYEDIALLDFETGAPGCPSGSPETSTTIRGQLEEGVTFQELRFRIGVPFRRNHDNVAEAPAPLNLTAMFWNWQGGYKFIRVDGASAARPEGFVLHLGSTGCDGDRLTGGTTQCSNANRPEVSLRGYNPATDVVAIDLAELFRGSNVDVDVAEQPGCQSRPTDVECEAIFPRLGLPFGSTPAAPQSVFRLRSDS